MAGIPQKFFVLLFCETDNPGNVFLWDDGAQDWWFTGSSLYPNIYSFGRGSWIFFFADSSSASDRKFVNLASGEFFAVP